MTAGEQNKKLQVLKALTTFCKKICLKDQEIYSPSLCTNHLLRPMYSRQAAHPSYCTGLAHLILLKGIFMSCSCTSKNLLNWATLHTKKGKAWFSNQILFSTMLICYSLAPPGLLWLLTTKMKGETTGTGTSGTRMVKSTKGRSQKTSY